MATGDVAGKPAPASTTPSIKKPAGTLNRGGPAAKNPGMAQGNPVKAEANETVGNKISTPMQFNKPPPPIQKDNAIKQTAQANNNSQSSNAGPNRFANNNGGQAQNKPNAPNSQSLSSPSSAVSQANSNQNASPTKNYQQGFGNRLSNPNNNVSSEVKSAGGTEEHQAGKTHNEANRPGNQNQGYGNRNNLDNKNSYSDNQNVTNKFRQGPSNQSGGHNDRDSNNKNIGTKHGDTRRDTQRRIGGGGYSQVRLQ